MSHKKMSKEVTKTIVKCALVDVVEGTPVMTTLEDEVILGNASFEHAQRTLNKRFGKPVTIIEMETDTQVYEMYVEDFIKHASIKVEKEEQVQEQE